ncbi:MAG: type II secretion system minor pseudopilin GspI, partial [Betaproteobacteria bacterium]
MIFRKPFSSILTRGFTLIEVLIALAVFAAVGVSLAKNSSTVVLQTSRMQDRVVALSVASNIANDFLVRGTDQPSFERANRKTREILQA